MALETRNIQTDKDADCISYDLDQTVSRSPLPPCRWRAEGRGRGWRTKTRPWHRNALETRNIQTNKGADLRCLDQHSKDRNGQQIAFRKQSSHQTLAHDASRMTSTRPGEGGERKRAPGTEIYWKLGTPRQTRTPTASAAPTVRHPLPKPSARLARRWREPDRDALASTRKIEIDSKLLSENNLRTKHWCTMHLV